MSPALKMRKSQHVKRDLKTLCAWCGRAKNPDGSWSMAPVNRSSEQFTHGICPNCFAEAARLN